MLPWDPMKTAITQHDKTSFGHLQTARYSHPSMVLTFWHQKNIAGFLLTQKRPPGMRSFGEKSRSRCTWRILDSYPWCGCLGETYVSACRVEDLRLNSSSGHLHWKTFFKAIKIITLNMPKKTRAVSHIASKQSFRALEHNLSQSWTCGLSGMPWPWKAWKCRRTPYTTQYFQISVFPHRNSQLWAATKILWQNAPCQEPFFGAVPRSEQTARFGDMFFAGHFLFLDEIDPKMPPSAIF